MEADFEDDFLEIWVGFQKVTNWKWKMEFYRTESVLTLKISGRELLPI